jgi:hypothetical protein
VHCCQGRVLCQMAQQLWQENDLGNVRHREPELDTGMLGFEFCLSENAGFDLHEDFPGCLHEGHCAVGGLHAAADPHEQLII